MRQSILIVLINFSKKNYIMKFVKSFSTQREENLYIKGTSFTIKDRTFGYGQTNIRLQLNHIS